MLEALDWQLRQLPAAGTNIDKHAENAIHRKLQESFTESKIPVFLLKAVLRYRYEKAKESKREHARRKSRQEKSSV
jgi:hypothetical protein